MGEVLVSSDFNSFLEVKPDEPIFVPGVYKIHAADLGATQRMLSDEGIAGVLEWQREHLNSLSSNFFDQFSVRGLWVVEGDSIAPWSISREGFEELAAINGEEMERLKKGFFPERYLISLRDLDKPYADGGMAIIAGPVWRLFNNLPVGLQMEDMSPQTQIEITRIQGLLMQRAVDYSRRIFKQGIVLRPTDTSQDTIRVWSPDGKSVSSVPLVIKQLALVDERAKEGEFDQTQFGFDREEHLISQYNQFEMEKLFEGTRNMLVHNGLDIPSLKLRTARPYGFQYDVDYSDHKKVARLNYQVAWAYRSMGVEAQASMMIRDGFDHPEFLRNHPFQPTFGRLVLGQAGDRATVVFIPVRFSAIGNFEQAEVYPDRQKEHDYQIPEEQIRIMRDTLAQAVLGSAWY